MNVLSVDVKNMNRWQAFAVHLGISVAIFMVLVGIMLLVWYPGVFIHFGGFQGVRIVAGVDLVLGPLLTLVVFNPLKKSLNVDLSIIAFIQFAALTLGVWTVYKERPMYQVLSHEGVRVLTYNELTLASKYTIGASQFDSSYPRIAYMDLPHSKREIASLGMLTALNDGLELYSRLDLYRNLGEKTEKENYEWFLQGRVFDSEKTCYTLPVISPHYTGEGCFSVSDGIVSIE